MAKYVNQIRYYKDGSPKNYPSGLKASELQYGSVFHNTLPIVQLGVQTLPGTRFYLNNHTEPIVIGQTGIYELNVDGLSYITDIKFDGTNLMTINNNDNSYLIVDYIYEKEEV